MRMPSMQHVAVCCWALQVQVAALNAETGTVVVCGSNFAAREYDRNLCVILSGTLVGTLVADACNPAFGAGGIATADGTAPQLPAWLAAAGCWQLAGKGLEACLLVLQCNTQA